MVCVETGSYVDFLGEFELIFVSFWPKYLDQKVILVQNMGYCGPRGHFFIGGLDFILTVN